MTFNEFKEKYEKKKVKEFQNSVNEEVVISVCVITYNHENYIRKCLESILSQKTNFSFEIVIGDDDSSDKTRDICIEYAEKHPQKIRFQLHHRENNIVIDGKPTGRFNFLYNLYVSKGKYIALCEGDDYWTDPLKLQKQLEFMQSYSNCKLCVTNGQYYYEEKNKFKYFDVPEREIDKQSRATSLKYIFSKKGVVFPTASFFFRKRDLLDNKLYEILNNIPVGDRSLQLRAILDGDICCLPCRTVVYRVIFNGDSWTSKNSKLFAVEALDKGIEEKNFIFREVLKNRFDNYKKYEISNLIVNHIYKSKVKGKLVQVRLLLKYFYKLSVNDLVYIIPRVLLIK